MGVSSRLDALALLVRFDPLSGDMRMKITLIILVALLAGCAPRISAWEINSLQQQCADRGGLVVINTVFPSAGVCMNGKWVYAERGK